MQYFADNGIKYVVSKGYVGDYQMLSDGTLAIDKKYGLQEVYSNIVCDHERFRRECIRAKEANIRLIFLVEQRGINSVADVAKWKNPRIALYNKMLKKRENGESVRLPGKPPMSSEKLAAAMQTMSDKYGIEWRFCDKKDTGKIIWEILTGKERENLERNKS